MLKIIYQGTQGSFSELAARARLGGEASYSGKETFLAVFEALTRKEADIAVIPIENTLIGSIGENQDLLSRFDVEVIGEKTLKIEHCLLGAKRLGVSQEERLAQLKRVYSHPKALEQCRTFFNAHPWIEQVTYFDTGGAAAKVATEGVEEGAIAGKHAASLYELDILKHKIEDDPQNFTRFLFLKRKNMRKNKRPLA